MINAYGINLFNQSINNEYRIIILETILQKILDKNPNLLTTNEIEKIKKDAVFVLQEKYPHAGIEIGRK